MKLLAALALLITFSIATEPAHARGIHKHHPVCHRHHHKKCARKHRGTAQIHIGPAYGPVTGTSTATPATAPTVETAEAEPETSWAEIETILNESAPQEQAENEQAVEELCAGPWIENDGEHTAEEIAIDNELREACEG